MESLSFIFTSNPQQPTFTGSSTSTLRYEPIFASWERAVELFNSQLTKDKKKRIKLENCPRAQFSDLLQEAKAAKIRVEKSRYPWTQVLQRVFTQINRYAVVGDIIVQHHAEYTSLVWGTFRFLLLFAVEEQRNSEKLSQALESIVQIIFRAEEYAKLFPAPSGTTARIFQSLQDNLTHLYAEILNFLVRAAMFFQKSSLRKAERLIWVQTLSEHIDRYASAGLHSDTKFQPILDRIGRHERDVEKDKNLLESESRKRQERYENGIWLRRADFDVDLQKLEESHLSDTCGWFLHGETYQKWQELSQISPDSSFLWIQGKPGCGKSVLASQIIRNVVGSFDDDAIVLYAFCKTGQENKNTLEALLRNLIVQLLTKSSQQNLLNEIVLEARMNEKTVYVQSMEVLWKLLECMLSGADNIFCVLDGLDECDDFKSEHNVFMTRLTNVFKQHLVKKDCARARMIVLSRSRLAEYPGIQSDWTNFEIQPFNVDDDIEKLVVNKIENSRFLKDHPKKAELLKKIVIDSEGMILWVDLMVQELERERWNVERVLQKLPRGLFATYNMIMERFTRQHVIDRVQCVLKHVVAAARPLSIQELALSVAVAEGLQKHSDYDQRGNATAEGIELVHECSPLLSILPDDTVQVVHSSLIEYICGKSDSSNASSNPSSNSTNSMFEKSEIHSHFAIVLLEYMLFDCFHTDLIEQTQPKNYLIEYASKWLVYHCTQTACSAHLQELLSRFMKSPQGWRWLERLSDEYEVSFDHLQLWQAQIRQWVQSSRSNEELAIFSDFLPVLSQSRYEEYHSLPIENHSRLGSMVNLAFIYSSQGQWKEAEELFAQVVIVMKKIFGEEHPKTLTSVSDLALTLKYQGRWKEAEELNVQVMDARKRIFGEEHPSTLTSMSNLALIYDEHGRWKESEELTVQVIDTRKRILGEEHPDTLITMSNLALLYDDQGRWKKSEELNVQVMETCKRILGGEHPITLIGMSNLASIYDKQGRWKESEELNVQVIDARKRILGEEHPITLISMNNLALIYDEQGRWKESEELIVQVIDARKRILGEEHPNTLDTMSNLALLYDDQGRWKESEELSVQVIETCKRILGGEHPTTLVSMNNLAHTYKAQNRTDEAIELMRNVVELSSRVIGADHSRTVISEGFLRLWEEEMEKEPGKPELQADLNEKSETESLEDSDEESENGSEAEI